MRVSTTDRLTAGLRLPMVAAPMFLISGPELVIAQARAGVVGSFPALNARPHSQLVDWFDEIEDALVGGGPVGEGALYAVNLIVHPSNARLEQDLALVCERRVPIVITSLGAREEVNAAVHAYGGVVLHDVIDDRFARKAVAKGADGLIAVAAGAGGHAGVLSPFAFVREIRSWFDGLLLLSGSISHGASIAAARALGADLAYVGSPFIATEEANAPVRYKQMVVSGTASDIVYTDSFTGVHANYLRGSIEASGLDPDALVPRNGIDFALDEQAARADGVKAWRDVWGAGQGIGAVSGIVPVAELVGRLQREYDESVAALVPAMPRDEMSPRHGN